MTQHLPRHTEGDIKNKFYTTLKRVATQAQLEDPIRYSSQFVKCKKNLVQFVDAAIEYGHLLSSKKGRKKNTDKLRARTQGMLFPKSLSPNRPMGFFSIPNSPGRYYTNVCAMPPVMQGGMQYPMVSLCPFPVYFQQPASIMAAPPFGVSTLATPPFYQSVDPMLAHARSCNYNGTGAIINYPHSKIFT